MKVHDPETNKDTWIDTSSKRTQEDYLNWWSTQQQTMHNAFKHSKVDNISVSTDDDFVKSLMMLFQQRS